MGEELKRFSPLYAELKSRVNAGFIIAALVLLGDFVLGGPLMGAIVRLQAGISGMNLSKPGRVIQTVFGSFSSVQDAARTYDTWLGLFLGACGLWGYVKGLIISLSRKV